jgi:hypothetical protein
LRFREAWADPRTGRRCRLRFRCSLARANCASVRTPPCPPRGLATGRCVPGPIHVAGCVVACASDAHWQEPTARRFALRLARHVAWPEANEYRGRSSRLSPTRVSDHGTRPTATEPHRRRTRTVIIAATRPAKARAARSSTASKPQHRAMSSTASTSKAEPCAMSKNRRRDGEPARYAEPSRRLSATLTAARRP